jgi:hypothetical protein
VKACGSEVDRTAVQGAHLTLAGAQRNLGEIGNCGRVPSTPFVPRAWAAAQQLDMFRIRRHDSTLRERLAPSHADNKKPPPSMQQIDAPELLGVAADPWHTPLHGAAKAGRSCAEGQIQENTRPPSCLDFRGEWNERKVSGLVLRMTVPLAAPGPSTPLQPRRGRSATRLPPLTN